MEHKIIKELEKLTDLLVNAESDAKEKILKYIRELYSASELEHFLNSLKYEIKTLEQITKEGKA